MPPSEDVLQRFRPVPTGLQLPSIQLGEWRSSDGLRFGQGALELSMRVPH